MNQVISIPTLVAHTFLGNFSAFIFRLFFSVLLKSNIQTLRAH